ncbi:MULTISPECIES: transposase [unclassified Bradyrhizobium]|uniref:transposase n=1 Tax=unclassified Bradyrhizobium TaxID=2631580 RepID=UPI001CD639EA|nr:MULTISPECIES: transposase [unclassified Bradyrhizobium]
MPIFSTPVAGRGWPPNSCRTMSARPWIGTSGRARRELDRLAEDLALLDREIAQVAIDDLAVNRLMTITGVNLAVAAGIVAAIGDISRFDSPQKLVSYFGLNPRVRQSGPGKLRRPKPGARAPQFGRTK